MHKLAGSFFIESIIAVRDPEMVAHGQWAYWNSFIKEKATQTACYNFHFCLHLIFDKDDVDIRKESAFVDESFGNKWIVCAPLAFN